LRYISTRGESPALDFEGVLLAGLAPDGGLYVPSRWPRLSRKALMGLRGLSYAELAAVVLHPYLGRHMERQDFAALLAETYSRFDHPAVAPLTQLDSNDWVMELFHGPTLAFKDMAMQVLGRLLDGALARRGRRATILGATSGDTGAAAVDAFRGRQAIDVFMLHPEGRISEVQRRQMTTAPDANVHNIAIQGTFDDCQALVKALFQQADLRDRLNLAAVNSINWARVMLQIAYYVQAAVALGSPDRAVAFSVPTGNFGDVYAGYAAAMMGLPVARLVVATNRNDILARFFASGEYRRGQVAATISPSMDIQVASNFERYVFDRVGRDAAELRARMAAFAEHGAFRVEVGNADLFTAAAVSEAETKAEIARIHGATGWLPDPHTAVGLAAARTRRGDPAVPMVTLATAHPAKFAEAVTAASGVTPKLPPRYADLMTRPERCVTLPNDAEAVKSHLIAHAVLGRARSAA
jgi:threonine synthase